MPDLQGQVARDHADAAGTHLEEGVALEHGLVLVEALLDHLRACRARGPPSPAGTSYRTPPIWWKP